MASALTNVSLSTFAPTARGDVLARPQVAAARVTFPTAYRGSGALSCRAGGPATPPGISDKMSDSIKEAQETCSEDAASDARDKLKDSDPLENYCKENPETDECRTYDS
ncbi:unnamed protein product [Triticum turgidum subsp. durum]|uniref:CP12 domain-containing protein n=1 Tax=Triticum turgidum subsp. durum TaxID=4567 RepID=A0A9R1PBX5_TRITD|nr:unnamed protein product [Triticum turgidum subsp. durum]VAH40538.1 unnamed protein product [Triticum turgidum subsp. durum]